MKLELKLLAFCCCVSFLCSCASVGRNFKYDQRAMELGKLKISDSNTLFGQPYFRQVKTSSKGQYEIIKYVYGLNSSDGVNQRVLILEFKDGFLNAYEYESSFEGDKTKVDLAKSEYLRGGIGKLSKTDVIAALGEPSGKSLCPSTLGDYKDRGANGIEIWAWFAGEIIKPGTPTDLKAKEVYVIFDKDNKVSDVQTSETVEIHK